MREVLYNQTKMELVDQNDILFSLLYKAVIFPILLNNSIIVVKSTSSEGYVV